MADEAGKAGPDSLGSGFGIAVPGFGLTPIYSNQFFVRVSNETTRIMFADTLHGATPHYHTSMIMTTENALLLAQLILDLHKKNQESPKPESPSR